MLKSKSLEDFNCVNDQQLFTELTPQEAAAIEGGYLLKLDSLKCFKETPRPGSDEISVRVEGRAVWYYGDFDSGEHWAINVAGEYNKPVTVSIWEEDVWGSNIIGEVYVTESTPRFAFRDLYGDGSHYRLNYGVAQY